MDVHRTDITGRYEIPNASRDDVFNAGIQSKIIPSDGDITLDTHNNVLDKGIKAKLEMGLMGIKLFADMFVATCDKTGGIAIVGGNQDFEAYLKFSMSYVHHADCDNGYVVSDETIVGSIFSVIPKSERIRKFGKVFSAHLGLLIPSFTAQYATNIRQELEAKKGPTNARNRLHLVYL